MVPSSKEEIVRDPESARLHALARVLDAAVGIPGTPIRIGVDALLGLIPGAGDVAGAVLSSYIILAAVRRGTPAAVLWRMVANVVVDTAIGSIPLIGDLFDVAWKANSRNVALLDRHARDPQRVEARSRGLGIVVAAVLLLVLLGLGTLAFLLARALWALLAG